MNRILEILLGLERGFLSRDGELSLQFNPSWPMQDVIGAWMWNLVLIGLAVWLVVHVYRREGRARPVRIVLGVVRLALLLLVIGLLNRPVLTLGQSRVEPSVLAILIDDSASMRVRDGGTDEAPEDRLTEAVQLLLANGERLPRELLKEHELRVYRFSSGAEPVTTLNAVPEDPATPILIGKIDSLQPTGQSTQIISSLQSVLEDLQGQRLAGVVLLSDGRESPPTPLAESLGRLKEFGVKIFPVQVGSDRAPINLEIQAVNVQDSAFVGDIVNVKVKVRASGLPAGKTVAMQLNRLIGGKTGAPFPNPGNGKTDTVVTLDDSGVFEVELQLKPEEVGTLDLEVSAVKQPGEIDIEDNTRSVQIDVLDAKVAVLYVDGYPRWEYRYLKNEMIRDKSVEISCLLTSADPTFAQEGDRPIKRFPESIGELMDYDVVLIGDVDPRQFTDAQLQLLSDFVANRGGGFGMIAGPQFSPPAFRGTAIEAMLPVNISNAEDDDGTTITEGFRPVLTPVGESSSIFRFFADRATNEKYLKEDLNAIFWYARGLTAKTGVAETYAEHPTDVGPDGRKAPILVLGRFGAGRTLFSAIDDSWRWRYYTGEQIFDTYWIQQIRYLARSKKLGQRRLTFTTLRPAYDLGQQVTLNLRVLDPQLLTQLPDQLRVEIAGGDGQVVRQETLLRQDGPFQHSGIRSLEFT